MKEHPILFDGPMVRAVLEGRKTQTRRLIKPQPDSYPDLPFAKMAVTLSDDYGLLAYEEEYPEEGCLDLEHTCPFGQPGDRLWVREKFSAWSGGMTDCGEEWDLIEGPLVEEAHANATIEYAATSASKPPRWRPSIHMPRWASRITLEVTGIRVERIQEIGEKDAQAEGFGIDTFAAKISPRVDFGATWERIYGLKSWLDNPWVWVVEFRRLP